jgi:cytochrome P450
MIRGLASAHRGGGAFDEPDEMGLHRAPNPQPAFGAGPCACVVGRRPASGGGRSSASYRTLLPTLNLAVSPAELKRREDRIIGGLRDLPVTW